MDQAVSAVSTGHPKAEPHAEDSLVLIDDSLQLDDVEEGNAARHVEFEADGDSDEQLPDDDADHEVDLPDQDAVPGNEPEKPIAPKRKGGRKPIYATSEERKQRNRQAQAAFRERRTEYIKQLETTIKHNEDALHNLQQSHRTAADECLMLRYKNSLLERILLEKGIDVQAELQTKSMSPTSRQHNAMTSAPQAPMQRPQQGRRTTGGPGLAPKVDTRNVPGHIRTDTMSSTRSSHSQTSSPMHFSSPALNFNRSPGMHMSDDMLSPRSSNMGQQPQHHHHDLTLQPPPPPRPMFGMNQPDDHHSAAAYYPGLSADMFQYGQHARPGEAQQQHQLDPMSARAFFPDGYSGPLDATGKLTPSFFPYQT